MQCTATCRKTRPRFPLVRFGGMSQFPAINMQGLPSAATKPFCTMACAALCDCNHQPSSTNKHKTQTHTWKSFQAIDSLQSSEGPNISVCICVCAVLYRHVLCMSIHCVVSGKFSVKSFPASHNRWKISWDPSPSNWIVVIVTANYRLQQVLTAIKACHSRQPAHVVPTFPCR